jgi:hypothetical protein
VTGLELFLPGSVAFAAPAALIALAALPAIWWLLRVTPPAPRRLAFPPLALLRDLLTREETAARTPWPLIVLRLLIAALVVVGLAGPLLNPDPTPAAAGPLTVVIDNGWAAARDWPARQAALTRLLEAAERRNRNVNLIATAPPADGGGVKETGYLTPAEARRVARALAPQPWPTDRLAAAAVAAAKALNSDGGPAHGVWLSDGLAGPGATELAAALQRLGSAEVFAPPAEELPRLLAPADARNRHLAALLTRAAASAPETIGLRAVADDGRILGRESVTLAVGETRREVVFNLPAELRNAAQSIRIEGENAASAVALLDERWRRRPVGLVSGRPDGEAQPLLSDLHYLRQALEPFTEVRGGAVTDLLAKELSLLVLSDVGALGRAEEALLTDWVRRGGLLVRFAGPRLSQSVDPLIPVRLRGGDRALGGAMSWSEPMALAPFPAEGPFAGLTVPADVLIRRQVLAEPTPDLAARSWARLTDGTPLVTFSRLGDGRIVLVHTAAGPDWSNLPLSGLFVEMLQRLVSSAHGVTGEAGEEGEGAARPAAAPQATLDGFGALGPPPATALPIRAGESVTVSPRHPPGLYGDGEARRALNLAPSAGDLQPLGALPAGVGRSGYDASQEIALQPWLLAAAFALLIIDLLAGLWLRGYLRGGRASLAVVAAMIIVAAGAGLPPTPARAAENPPSQAMAMTETVLAYVISGDAQADATARAGLRGLQGALNRRTAIETAGVIGVNVERDELAFYPLLYWPLTARQETLSEPARARVDAYLRHGGVILFDTRDGGDGGAGTAALRRALAGISLPPLTPVGAEHVLTKAFYLMSDFPGRRPSGPLWVEAADGARNDGVSSVVIGGGDWAAAWAVDETGMALYPVVPGGERQREFAYRFGVNLMMYALTGNYKADQVHVPAILERLGQ